jgi:hypothetical protein
MPLRTWTLVRTVGVRGPDGTGELALQSSRSALIQPCRCAATSAGAPRERLRPIRRLHVAERAEAP